MIRTYKITHFCLKLKEDQKLYMERLCCMNIVSHFKSLGHEKSECLKNGRTVAKWCLHPIKAWPAPTESTSTPTIESSWWPLAIGCHYPVREPACYWSSQLPSVLRTQRISRMQGNLWLNGQPQANCDESITLSSQWPVLPQSSPSSTHSPPLLSEKEMNTDPCGISSDPMTPVIACFYKTPPTCL